MSYSVPETGFKYIRKTFRGLSYLSFVFGSIASMFFPSTVIADLTSDTYARAWAILFLLASIICFVGVMLQNWVVEYIGLPLLSSVFYIFSLCLVLSVGEETYNFIAFAFIYFGVAIHLTVRYKELRHYFNVPSDEDL